MTHFIYECILHGPSNMICRICNGPSPEPPNIEEISKLVKRGDMYQDRAIALEAALESAQAKLKESTLYNEMANQEIARLRDDSVRAIQSLGSKLTILERKLDKAREALGMFLAWINPQTMADGHSAWPIVIKTQEALAEINDSAAEMGGKT